VTDKFPKISQSRSLDRMKNVLNFIIALVIAAIVFSCAPKPKHVQVSPVELIPTPYNLGGKAINGKAMISWEINRPKIFASEGYNIYISEISSSDTGKLYNNIPYPGDTDGDPGHETFQIDGLTNGRFYEVWVRMLSADGKLGPKSEIRVFRPLEMGELTIYFDILHDSSGYSFAKHKYTKARDYDNDFYLFDKNGPRISSPSLYNSGLRESIFANLAAPPPRLSKEFRNHTDFAKITSMVLSKNNIYAIRTKDGIADIEVKSFIGTSDKKRALIKYLYIPFGDDKHEINADSLSRNLTD
jgi:hypothetical protein